jgi:hypothetical protein
MKKLAVFTLILLFVAGIAYAKDYEVTKKAGEFNTTVKIDKNPPIAGDNNVSIEIKDASGHYVKDAKVIVEYSMPAMAGMPAMRYKADAELKGDEYKAKMNLSMAGSWNIAVKITRVGKTSTMKFTVDAK